MVMQTSDCPIAQRNVNSTNLLIMHNTDNKEHTETMLTLFKAHCCHMGTAIKHPVPNRVKPSFVIFDIRALWRSAMSVRVLGCQKLQITA